MYVIDDQIYMQCRPLGICKQNNATPIIKERFKYTVFP